MNLYDVTNPFIAGIKGAVALQGVPIRATVKEPAAAITEQHINNIRSILEKADET